MSATGVSDWGDGQQLGSRESCNESMECHVQQVVRIGGNSAQQSVLGLRVLPGSTVITGSPPEGSQSRSRHS